MTGYAVLDPSGEILLRTVSDTARGAKVNWIYTYARIPVLDRMRDELIAQIFESLRGKAELVEVEIKVRES